MFSIILQTFCHFSFAVVPGQVLISRVTGNREIHLPVSALIRHMDFGLASVIILATP